MILLLDDDLDQLEITGETLRAEGFEVRAFSSAAQAIEAARATEPELILSDVRMPGTDGYSFKKSYAATFPDRDTPFVFQSSIDNPAAVVRGLDLGADDYLLKPVHPTILIAKVKAILRRRKKAVVSFAGTLARFSLPDLLRYVERQGLTGRIRFAPGEGGPGDPERVLEFVGGCARSEGADELLDWVMAEDDARFVIEWTPPDFSEIAFSRSDPPEAPPPEERATVPPEPSEAAPAQPVHAFQPIPGEMSLVGVAGAELRVQTELLSSGASPGVMTLIIDGADVVKKRITPVSSQQSTEAVQLILRAQHRAAELEAEGLARERAAATMSPGESERTARQLFADGIRAYKAGEFVKALEKWEEAEDYMPDHKVLQFYLEVVRSRLSL